MISEPAIGPLSGRWIALPETRELDRLARMLEAEGAESLRCPLVAIRDTPDPLPVQQWLGHFPFDDLILYTGEGLRRRHGFACRFDSEAGFLDGLRRRAQQVYRCLGSRGPERRRVDRSHGRRRGRRDRLHQFPANQAIVRGGEVDAAGRDVADSAVALDFDSANECFRSWG